MEELLKSLGLEETVITSITEAMAEQKIYTTSLQNADTRYKKAKEKITTLEGEITTKNAEIETLKDNSNIDETLKTENEKLKKELQKTKDDFATRLDTIEKDALVDKLLADNKAKYTDLLRSKFDYSKIKKDEETLEWTGLTEQLEAIKTTYADMFVEDSNPASNILKGKKSTNKVTNSLSSITKEQFAKMSYKEKLEIYNADQELYKSLNS